MKFSTNNMPWMRPFQASALALLISVGFAPTTESFMTPSSSSSSSLSSLIFPVRSSLDSVSSTALASTSSSSSSSSHGRSGGDVYYNVEQARAWLENLLEQQGEMESSNMLAKTEGQDMLTATGRHRRLLEIELIKSLKKSEEGVNELMQLWMYENEHDMAHELEEMQNECSPGMVAEEKRLHEMIEEFPHWAEARARLALLLFFKGHNHESYDVAIQTLQIKPWHFEIYPLLVMISLREKQLGQALFWARRSLPPLREGKENRRRHEWIRIAVELAEGRLAEADQRTLQAKGHSFIEQISHEGDAWQ